MSTCEQMSESHRQVEAGQTGRSVACLDPPMHDLTSHQSAKQLSQLHACRTCYALACLVLPSITTDLGRSSIRLTTNQSRVTPNRPVNPNSQPLISHARRARVRFTCTQVSGEPKSSTPEAATVFQPSGLPISESVWREQGVTQGEMSLASGPLRVSAPGGRE